MFFALAPGVVAGVVPWWLTGWDAEPARLPLRVLGAVVLAASAAVLLHAFARFVARGRGHAGAGRADAHLVVGGLYRHVRNPMYVAVVGAVVGQALLLGQLGLLRLRGAPAGAVRRLRARLRGADAQAAVRAGVRRVPRGGAGLVAASTAGTTPARDELSSSSSPGCSRRSACSAPRAATCSAGSARPRAACTAARRAGSAPPPTRPRAPSPSASSSSGVVPSARSASSSRRSTHLCSPSPPGSTYGVSTIGSARGLQRPRLDRDRAARARTSIRTAPSRRGTSIAGSSLAVEHPHAARAAAPGAPPGSPRSRPRPAASRTPRDRVRPHQGV